MLAERNRHLLQITGHAAGNLEGKACCCPYYACPRHIALADQIELFAVQLQLELVTVI